MEVGKVGNRGAGQGNNIFENILKKSAFFFLFALAQVTILRT